MSGTSGKQARMQNSFDMRIFDILPVAKNVLNNLLRLLRVWAVSVIASSAMPIKSMNARIAAVETRKKSTIILIRNKKKQILKE
jgi:hypothetical protein